MIAAFWVKTGMSRTVVTSETNLSVKDIAT